MPFAVAITKRAMFQGREEEFSNVYQYGGASPTDAEASALIDFLVAEERGVHAAAVTFVLGFVYEIGGTPAENLPILRKDLSGTGDLPTLHPIYRECAVMVFARSSRPSSLGRPVYFRKWLHACALPNSSDGTAAVAGNGAISSATQSLFTAYMSAVMTPTVNGIEYVMQATNGGTAQTPPTCFPYLEHRQFPQGRKETNGTNGT